MHDAPSASGTLTPAERILHTAHDLFYRNGVRATGIDRVIEESKVTKVTFYRAFASKNDLILAYIRYRHRCWMSWFVCALERHQVTHKGVKATIPTMAEWFGSSDYRGCAFINSVAEVGDLLPELKALSRSHKQDMVKAIAHLLPASRRRARTAAAIGVAIDGAIIQAQFGFPTTYALDSLALIVAAVES